MKNGAWACFLALPIVFSAALPDEAAAQTKPVAESRIEGIEETIKALSEELKALKAENKRLEEEKVGREELSARAASSEESGVGSAVTQGPDMSFPRGPSFKVGDTNIRIGGYVKADAFYDVGPQGGAARFDPGIPLDGTQPQDDGEFSFSAAETRVNISTASPAGDYGNVVTFVEAQFFDLGSFNSSQTIANTLDFELRHAWGQLGTKDLNVRAGQDWSTFIDPVTYPENNDFAVPAGASFLRQPQVRLTTKAGPGTLAVAVENPESDLTAFNGTTTGGLNLGGGLGNSTFGGDEAPDFITRYSLNGDFGRLNFFGLARLLSVDRASLAGADDTALGWGLGVSGKIKTFGKDNVRFALNGGDGIGRYIFDAQNSGAFVTAAGNLETQFAYGGYLSYQHFWTDTVRSNATFGHTEINLDDANTLGGANESLSSVHLNLMWNPVPRVRIGAEYIYAMRDVQDGREGDFSRIQASARFDF